MMTRNLLLPQRFKTIGWWILIPAALAGIVLIAQGFESNWIQAPVFAIFDEGIFEGDHFMQVIHTNITPTLIGVLFLVGALMVAFSEEKQEDEFIANLRLSSLLWSVWVNYLLLLLGFLFVYGFAFLHIMIYNMFTILIIFIIRFNYILYRNSKSTAHEK